MATNLDLDETNELEHRTKYPVLSSTPKLKRPRTASNSCTKCEVQIDHVLCSVCKLVFCCPCAKISPILAAALKEDKSNNFKWTCNNCKQNFRSMTNLSAQLRSIEEKTEIRITSIENRLDNIKEDIHEQVNREMENFKPLLMQEIQEGVTENMQEKIRKEIREIEDQKRHLFNLVLFNVKESTQQTPSLRKRHDEHKVAELFRLLVVQQPDIKVLFRIGNKSPQKDRPLKIIIRQERKNILDNAHKIKTIPVENDLKRCIIVKDLTISQREENKKRRIMKK